MAINLESIRIVANLTLFNVGGLMSAFAKNEAEIADRVSRYLKAELKRADVTYAGLAERLAKHGMKERPWIP
jgi:hypothetical protein